MGLSAEQIAQMSREEKLMMMEALWADLSRKDDEVGSPDWHNDALLRTSERRDAGEEPSVDWDEAKQELRKKFD